METSDDDKIEALLIQLSDDTSDEEKLSDKKDYQQD